MIACEVVIVGGGLGGLTLAASLGAAGIDVVCLEREAPSRTRSAAHDGRTTAIAYGPQQVLAACGVWDKIERDACPILRIHVADQDSPPSLSFLHHEVGAAPFGWIVDNRTLRRALEERIAELKRHVRVLAPAQMATLDCGALQARVTLTDGRVVTAQLAVGADGRRSASREQAGIGSYGWDYGQTAIVATLLHEIPHDNIAVENFLPGGPLATLPMTDARRGHDGLTHRSSLVWSEQTAAAQALMTCDEAAFTAALQEKVGAWLGRVRLEGPRFAYPLNLRRAKRLTAPRFALVSEAAHGIHPIAGQGLNLGMRDIAALRDELVRATRLGLDLGHPDILRRYEHARRFDNGAMVLGMDLLVRLFSNAIPPVQTARRFGLGLVQHIGPVRRFFMRVAMGERDTAPFPTPKTG